MGRSQAPCKYLRYGCQVVRKWFGVPKVLISNNGLQFDSKAFHRYFLELGFTNRYSTPSYRQGNGQAEATNKSIANSLKRRLDDSKGRWTEELPSVLWAY